MSLAGPCAQLIGVLAEPARARGFAPGEWSRLVAAARAANLLGALAERLHDAGIEADPSAGRHLLGARQLAARQHLSVRWEAHCLQQTLGQLGVPVVLLKGAAYVLSGHEVARGRMFGDIDILVPRAALGDVESALMLDGWVSAKTDAYDQRYYREWMHELPPMVHLRRGTVIDVHHTILPLTSRNVPDPAQIVARARPLADLPALRVPSPEDLVIHSITHLVHEGEVHNGLRDLHDIDVMLRSFASASGFWDRLVDGAAGNDLARPVAFGLRLARRFFDTPMPIAVLRALPYGRGPATASWLERIYERALSSVADSRADALAGLARQLIYLRAHGLRMPPWQLARHLGIKAWRRLRLDEPPAA